MDLPGFNNHVESVQRLAGAATHTPIRFPESFDLNDSRQSVCTFPDDGNGGAPFRELAQRRLSEGTREAQRISRE